MHLLFYAEGIWLRIWKRDGVARINSKGYLLHSQFRMVLFLRSDIVHSGIFGSSGNVQLHCTFQPVDNPGDKSLFLHVDPTQTSNLDIGNLNKVVYAHCVYHEENDNVAIPVVADHKVEFFKQSNYLKDYIHHVGPRCDNASGYSDLLPYPSNALGSNPNFSMGIGLSNDKNSSPPSIKDAGLTVAIKREGGNETGHIQKRTASSSGRKISKSSKKTKPLDDSDKDYVEEEFIGCTSLKKKSEHPLPK